MTKIDEVARAILKARFYDCEPEMYGNDLDAFFREIDADHIVDAHDEARAAIEAMREPTRAMSDAGRDNNYMRYADPAWRAMIDAALREEGR